MAMDSCFVGHIAYLTCYYCVKLGLLDISQYITLNPGTSDVNQFVLDGFRSVHGIPRGGLEMMSKNSGRR